MKKNKIIREHLSFEESLTEFKHNINYYLKNESKIICLLKSLNKNTLFKEIENLLESDNDKKAFIDFVEKTKPRYIKKESDEYGGIVYTYEKKIIWQPVELYDINIVEKVWNENFSTKPNYCLIGNRRFTFNSFKETMYLALKDKKKKISYIFI